ncbi:MAG: hypothetical protein RL091_3706, partial [Verrucomicrobiota bacterium]
MTFTPLLALGITCSVDLFQILKRETGHWFNLNVLSLLNLTFPSAA